MRGRNPHLGSSVPERDERILHEHQPEQTLCLYRFAGIAYRLVQHADVVIENFRPGKTAKLGIDYETLLRYKPDLIYLSISAFGQDSPLRDRPGYDFIAQAMSGLMALTGQPDGEPMKAGVPTADLVTGLYGAIAVLSALYHRSQTGRGQYIDLSLFDYQLSLCTTVAANYFVSGKEPGRYGNAHPNIVPNQSFPTADGEIAVAVGNDSQFDDFVKIWDILSGPRTNGSGLMICDSDIGRFW